MSADVLDLPNLIKLVRELGLDLLDLWKLERFWVVDTFTRLNALHFVNCLVIEDAVLPAQALAEINSADPTQSTPSIPYIPSPSVPPVPTIDPLPSNNILYPPDAGLEFDRAIQDHGSMDASMSSPSVLNTVDAGSSMVASLQSVHRPTGPDAGPASYPTPSTHGVNPPAAGGPLVSPSACCSPQVYQVVNAPQSVRTPVSTSATTPVGFSDTPGSDAGASSYPTPSTNYADSPRVDESTTRLSSSVLPLNQAVEAPESTPNTPTQQQRREQAIIRSLQSCTFTKENVRLDIEETKKIIKAGARLLTQDHFRILRPLFDGGADMSSSLKRLGLPEEWVGVNGAVNYLRVLEKDKDKRISFSLDPLARRVAQVLLYLNYMSLRKKGEQDLVTRILDAYHDDPNKSKGKVYRQKNFHTYHVRLGRWWWRLAAHLGLGILLVADDVAMNLFSNRFTDDQIDALITFALRTRPGTIHLYRSLAPVAKSLLSGELPANLRQILMDANKGLLRHNALEEARTQDENASMSQEIAGPWQVENTKPYAEKTATDFIDSLTH
ncbi:serine proline rich protein [Aspergillus fumigatus]|nr:serine proline rich protein [Aspergillus fumigatus]